MNRTRRFTQPDALRHSFRYLKRLFSGPEPWPFGPGDKKKPKPIFSPPRLAAGLVVFLTLLEIAQALQTNQVELGNDSVYDETVLIERSEDGRLLLRDSEVTSPVALRDLTGGVSTHAQLLGLTADDHPQYLNDARHAADHVAGFNALLSIPTDVDGNSLLGDHVLDNDIHLPRDETVSISGDWRFTGSPIFWRGLSFTAEGSPGDVAFDFESAGGDARFSWLESAGRFDLNRPLAIDGDLSSSADGYFSGRLEAENGIYGEVAENPLFGELFHLTMDDAGPDPTVRDALGHYDQTFLDPTGDADADAHTTSGLIGDALSFDGVDDLIDCGVTPSDDALTTGHDFTIAFWWKSPDQAADVNIFGCMGASTDARIMVMPRSFGSTRLQIILAGRNLGCYVSGGADGAWHHFAARRRGDTLSWFHDGAEVFANTAPENRYSLAGGPMVIGARYDGYGPARGACDDFRMYARGLSDGEIAAVYATGAGTDAPARYVQEIDGALSVDSASIGCAPSEYTLDIGGAGRFQEGLGVDGALTTGALQVGGGAYCDGNTWVDLSSRAAKIDIAPTAASEAWTTLDELRVVEFAYRKRNPNRGKWVDAEGRPVAQQEVPIPAASEGSAPLGPEAAAEQPTEGFHVDRRRFLDEPEPRRQLGFIAEDLPPKLRRGHGVAPIEIAAFNTSALQEARRRILSLERETEALADKNAALRADLTDLRKRVEALENGGGH